MIVVTGGTGLLGSHLLYFLTKNNGESNIRASFRSQKRIDQVRKLFLILGGESAIVDFDRIEWRQADLCNPHDVGTLLENCSQVYHCAALVSFFSSDFSRLLKQNKEVTALLVNTCLEIPNIRLCYVSSTAALGFSKNDLTTENSKWELTKGTSAYSISKHLAEKEVWRGIEEGLDAVIINPCVILGAGNWNDSSLSILKTASKGISFYTPGSNAIVDARDVAQCMILLMNSQIKKERFLCTGENISFLELFNKLTKYMGTKSPRYKVAYNLALFVALFNEWFQLFSNNKKGLSRDTVKSSFKTITYSKEKLKSAFNHTFFSLDETIDFSIKNKIS
ncbi:MAG: NAD-dependent epimerase/dehydratase family protein [Crocinitomicaceae bacterium]